MGKLLPVSFRMRSGLVLEQTEKFRTSNFLRSNFMNRIRAGDASEASIQVLSYIRPGPRSQAEDASEVSIRVLLIIMLHTVECSKKYYKFLKCF